MNFRTPDNQRSFFFEGFVGNEWKRNQLQARISYFYNEPDTTIALFSDNEYGHTNRKGPRIQLMFFPQEAHPTILLFGITGMEISFKQGYVMVHTMSP